MRCSRRLDSMVIPADRQRELAEPIVWDQSRIAIDDRLTVSFMPGSLDFGSEPVATPEPTEWILIVAGLAALVTTWLSVRPSTLPSYLRNAR